jgi:ABC-type branched-subunit amino acid transport system permease subunit
LWWPHILVELLLLLLNTCAVLHALSLNILWKFVGCLLLGHDMANYWLVHHGLRLYSVAINNRCNRVALWRI